MAEFSLGEGALKGHSFKQIKLWRHKLVFKEPAGTSRGVYRTRDVWYIEIVGSSAKGYKISGIGECAPLYDLSCDALSTKTTDVYEEKLMGFVQRFCSDKAIDLDSMRDYPSMLMGLETAVAHYNYLYEHANSSDMTDIDHWAMTDTPFAAGEEHIQINGLIWMGSFDEMYQRIKAKMDAGFKCIKLKIGAIDFEKELELLGFIRQHFSKEEVELRVDANGAFSPDEAMNKLERLSKFDLHSIEQPIKAYQLDKMRELCRNTPIPIALDEELIGVNTLEGKKAVMDINPQYIILKPTLHGGFIGAKEWIDLAEEKGIPYWATSALESNVGLNAISQWCSLLGPKMPQGLGTGQLFTNNFEIPLTIEGDGLYLNRSRKVPSFKDYLTMNDAKLLIEANAD